MAKETTETTETPAKKTAATHRMYVGRQPIHEGGQTYAPGAEIDLPSGRAKALGSLVSTEPLKKG